MAQTLAEYLLYPMGRTTPIKVCGELDERAGKTNDL